MSQIKVGFVLEQTLGHVTHSKNLLANISDDASLSVAVAPIDFEMSGVSAKVPLYSNWTVRAGMRARRAVNNLNRQEPLDALFIHTQVPAVLMTKWLKKIPTIVSLDATPLQYDQLGEFYEHESGNSWAETLKWRANQRCFQLAQRLVAWSQWAKDGLVDEYQIEPDKIIVIPPGVNLHDWPEQERKAETEGPLKILFVGGDLQRKGGYDLLEAFRSIRETHQSDDSQKQQVELHMVTHAKIESQPGLTVYNNLQPNSEPLKNLFQTCDIFCLPTYGDCLPMVLSEAGAVGLPLISTNVAAIPEIVQDGNSGLLIQPGDKAALTTALQTLIDDAELRIQMGKNAAQLVRQRYDGKKNAQQLLDTLKSISTNNQYL